jgi:hypothetical protein
MIRRVGVGHGGWRPAALAGCPILKLDSADNRHYHWGLRSPVNPGQMGQRQSGSVSC